jgi:thioredoxin 1
MSQQVFEVTSANFQAEVLESALPVLVEFGADWCPPCKMIEPLVAEIARKYAGQLRVGTLDSDLHPDVIQEYGVMGLPTLILFRNGAAVKRMVGYQPRERLEAQLVPHLQPQQA